MELILALDLDGLYDLVEDPAPWFEASSAVVLLMLGAAAVHAGRQRLRRSRSPMAKLMQGRLR